MKKKLPTSWLSALRKAFSSPTNSPSSPPPLPPLAFDNTTQNSSTGDSTARSAAIKIQSAFRGYLAKRALRSLRALVRLQALVRGHCIRRRTEVTLRCMISLLRVQARGRHRRTMKLAGVEASEAGRTRFRDPPGELPLWPWMSVYGPFTNIQARIESSGGLGSTADHSSDQLIIGSSNRRSGFISEQLSMGSSRNHLHREKDAGSFKPAALRQIRTTTKPVKHDLQHSSLHGLSPPLQAKPTCRNPERSQVSAGWGAASGERRPSYMALTESAKARIRALQVRSKNKSSTADSSPVCSTPSSPPQRDLWRRSSLPPIRTGRLSDWGETTPFSEGEIRRRGCYSNYI